MNFIDNLIGIFTIMCQDKNCPLAILNSTSKCIPKTYNSILVCPFADNKDCRDVTLDDWDDVFNKSEIYNEKI